MKQVSGNASYSQDPEDPAFPPEQLLPPDSGDDVSGNAHTANYGKEDVEILELQDIVPEEFQSGPIASCGSRHKKKAFIFGALGFLGIAISVVGVLLFLSPSSNEGPSDASWSSWSTLGSCSGNCKTRGEAVPKKFRSRTCIPEKFGGKNCSFLEDQARLNQQPLHKEEHECFELPDCPGDSVLLITGGVGTASTEVFPSCSSPPPLPSTRAAHQSFKTSDPTPLIATCGGGTGGYPTASCLVLDLENQRWDESRMGNLTTPRYWGAVVELKQGVLFLGGGGSPASTTSDFLATGSLQWQQGPRLPQYMDDFCAVPVSPTKFLTIDGDKILEFDAAIAGPTSEEGWRDSTLWPTLKTSRDNYPGCAKIGDKVILAGGYDGRRVLRSTEVLDITTRTISTGGDMATPREWFNLATISRGGGDTTFAIAGLSSLTTDLNSVEEWEEESSTWKAAGNLDTARDDFGVVTIPKKIICPT